MPGLKKHKFATVKVAQPVTETATAAVLDLAMSAAAAEIAQANPRGAPFTLSLPKGIVPLPLGKEPSYNPTPLADDAGETPIIVPYTAPCALDEASVGSKIVVVVLNEVKTPLLSTPNGFIALASDDAAWRLPLGARVQRTADGFVSTQLDPAQDRPDLITTTAREAIRLFGKHFHDQRD